MATESQQRKGTTGSTDADSSGNSAPEDDGSAQMSAAEAATVGLGSVVELTGKQPEGVIAVEPAGEGWIIAVEVVEDRRVPSSADILATYEAELDSEGVLLACRRTRRYARGRGDGGRRLRT